VDLHRGRDRETWIHRPSSEFVVTRFELGSRSIWKAWAQAPVLRTRTHGIDCQERDRDAHLPDCDLPVVHACEYRETLPASVPAKFWRVQRARRRHDRRSRPIVQDDPATPFSPATSSVSATSKCAEKGASEIVVVVDLLVGTAFAFEVFEQAARPEMRIAEAMRNGDAMLTKRLNLSR
jgi:hypothetical protein